MEEKLKLAEAAYQKGCTCSQAVFCAFADELGLDKSVGCRLMEGFGGGFGGLQEVCGAFSAAAAIISFYTSAGTLDGQSKGQTYAAIRRAAQGYAQEYGSIRCLESLHGRAPQPKQCTDKVRAAVLLVPQVLKEDHSKLGE